MIKEVKSQEKPLEHLEDDLRAQRNHINLIRGHFGDSEDRRGLTRDPSAKAMALAL